MDAVQSLQRTGTREHLPEFMDFIERACNDAHASEDAAYALRLAVEEVCLNLMHYGYAGMRPGPIGIDFAVDGDVITLTVRDQARPFHPDEAPEPDLAADAANRPIGGLGWYLVKRLVDEISYCTDARSGNRLTLVKRAAIRRKEA